MNLLHVDSSPLVDASVSRQLTAVIVDEWRRLDPSLTVTRRDVGAEPLEQLSADLLNVLRLGQQDGIDGRLQAEVELTDRLIAEFLAADVVVIGAPMYNFTVSTQLKSWIDRIAQSGRTFRYTEAGPVGLATGKRTIIVSSRGGIYSGESSAMDFQEPYLRAVLGFLGLTDVTVVRAEGINLSPEARQQALGAAHGQIEGLLRTAA